MLDYERLDVYQRSIEFLALAFAVAERVPRGYASLADQLRRAAMSIPLNIAEGSANPTDLIGDAIMPSLVAPPWNALPSSMLHASWTIRPRRH